MSNIAYTYEVINVNPQARAMEVVYTSPGRQTLHIGARMPYAGETIEQIAAMYAPVGYWLEQEAQIVDVPVGTSGTVSPPGVEPTTIGSARQAKASEISSWRYMLEVGGVSLNGVKVKTDRESQATINGAYTSLANGLLTSIDWKTADGSFVQLTLAEMSAVAQAVAQHVQTSFSREKALLDQVNAATTIEEVKSVVVPWSEVGVATADIPVSQL